ncbi:MAG: TAXI family TRAP transporter solute-binding subunit [Desulfobacterales bacterium]|nr:TAXI family TRAP transporter solute-binding subunit [Desulfobacterales bacterium]
MMKKIKNTLRIGLGVMVCSLFLQTTILPPENGYADVTQLSMGTATVGGFFYNVGAPVAQCINKNLPEVNVTAEFTEGSVENLRLIQKKKMHLAVISPMIGFFAAKGTEMFKKSGTVNFRVLARLLPNGNIWTTLKSNTTIKTIRDLRGKKVGVGTGGIGVMARMQLAVHGIDDKKDIKPFYLATGALADALKDGSVDASFLTEELAEMVTATHEIRVIPWLEEDRAKYIDKNPYFGAFSYPPNTFKGVDYEVQTVDNGIQLIADADMSDDMAYKLSKTVVENIDCMGKIFAPAKALKPEWMASELGNPFHPGSLKYFKDKGLKK